jgi:hypothetical protein
MSYDIELTDPVTKKVLTVENRHHIRGSNYCVGGDDRLSTCITYNYAQHFQQAFKEFEKPEVIGIRVLYGMTGAESIPFLTSAIAKLGDDVNRYYWAATEGNAKAALYGLLAFAQLRPDGVWQGD